MDDDISREDNTPLLYYTIDIYHLMLKQHHKKEITSGVG